MEFLANISVGRDGFLWYGDRFPTMLIIIAVIMALSVIPILGLVIFKMIRGSVEWNSNNNSPELTVNAKVVTKRTAISMYNNNSSSTTYFVAFEVENGDRVELKVKGKEYGMVAEDDVGKLTFQGTRYKKFERETFPPPTN